LHPIQYWGTCQYYLYVNDQPTVHRGSMMGDVLINRLRLAEISCVRAKLPLLAGAVHDPNPAFRRYRAPPWRSFVGSSGSISRSYKARLVGLYLSWSDVNLGTLYRDVEVPLTLKEPIATRACARQIGERVGSCVSSRTRIEIAALTQTGLQQHRRHQYPVLPPAITEHRACLPGRTRYLTARLVSPPSRCRDGPI